MKYLIPLYFILFLSIITIINVFSSSLQPTTPQTVDNTKYKWKTMNKSLNGTFITTLGIKAVNFYNQKHPNRSQLYFENVTSAEKRGKKPKGNKQIRLTISVSRLNNKTVSSGLFCHHLRAIFNVSTEGNKTIVKERRLNVKQRLSCAIKDNTTQNAKIRGDLATLANSK